MAQWDDLPLTDLWDILLEADYRTVLSTCRTTRRTQTICDTARFWFLRLERDYPQVVRASWVEDDEDASALRELYISLVLEYDTVVANVYARRPVVPVGDDHLLPCINFRHTDRFPLLSYGGTLYNGRYHQEYDVDVVLQEGDGALPYINACNARMYTFLPEDEDEVATFVDTLFAKSILVLRDPREELKVPIVRTVYGSRRVMTTVGRYLWFLQQHRPSLVRNEPVFHHIGFAKLDADE